MLSVQLFLFLAIGLAVADPVVPPQCQIAPGDDTCPPGCAGYIDYVVYVVDDDGSTTTLSTISGSSSSSTTSTYTTTTSATEPETTILSCPGDHQSVFTGQSGSAFLVNCFSSLFGVEINARDNNARAVVGRSIGTSETFNGCMQLCDDQEGCEAVSYAPGSGICRGFTEPVTTSNSSPDGDWIALVQERVNTPESSASTTSTSTTSTRQISSETTTSSSSSPPASPESQSTPSGGTISESSSSESTSSGPTSSPSTETDETVTDPTASETVTTDPIVTDTTATGTTASDTTRSDSTAIETTTTTPPPSSLTCDKDDQKEYVASAGSTFRIDCNIGLSGDEIRGAPLADVRRSLDEVSSLNDCIDLCSEISVCAGVSYNFETGDCRAFESPSTTESNGEWVALRVDDSAPSTSPEASTSSTQTSTTTDTSSIEGSSAAESSTATGTPSATETPSTSTVPPSATACPDRDTFAFDGRTFRVDCTVGIIGAIIFTYIGGDLERCIDTCSTNPSCRAVGFEPSLPECMLFSSASPTALGYQWAVFEETLPTSDSSSTTPTSTTSVTGIPTPSSTGSICPDDDGQLVDGGNNKQFLVFCDTDVRGDLTQGLDAFTFDDCIRACGRSQSCDGVWYYDTEAYCELYMHASSFGGGMGWGAILQQSST